MNRSFCRWGILGTANIARKNWQAIRDSGNAVLIAVASRDAARSAGFTRDGTPSGTPGPGYEAR